MKHLLPTTEEQTIKIIPRVYSENITFSLRDDSTNKTLLIEPENVLIKNNYLEITSLFDLKEGRFYDLKVYLDDDSIIYRDKIFCTIQSTNQSEGDKYTINKDVYKEKKGNNDFIIL